VKFCLLFSPSLATMQKCALLLMGLLCVGDARRVQSSLNLDEEETAKALALALFALNPAPTGEHVVADILGARKHRTAGRAPVMHHTDGASHELPRVSSVPVMKASPDIAALAATCLEEGCPVDEVTSLIAALKAIEPSAEVKQTISQLEELVELVADPETNKNALRDLVAAVGKGLGYSGKPLKKTNYAYDVFNPKPASSMAVALNCLEAGCSTETVEELIASLKAEKNPDSEVATTIKQLELLLATPTPNKNAIEELVAKVSQGFKVVGDSYTTPQEVMGIFKD
jgi:hypothetical protein